VKKKKAAATEKSEFQKENLSKKEKKVKILGGKAGALYVYKLLCYFSE
jgi:hypothetical protein